MNWAFIFKSIRCQFTFWSCHRLPTKPSGCCGHGGRHRKRIETCRLGTNLIVQPGSSLVEGGEGLYLPNCQTNLVIALYTLSLLFCEFINTTFYHLGRYKSSSPISCSPVQVYSRPLPVLFAVSKRGKMLIHTFQHFRSWAQDLLYPLTISTKLTFCQSKTSPKFWTKKIFRRWAESFRNGW